MTITKPFTAMGRFYQKHELLVLCVVWIVMMWFFLWLGSTTMKGPQ